MALTIAEYRTELERRRGKQEEIKCQLNEALSEQRKLSILGRKLEEARAIIRVVSLQTQQEIQYQISAVVTAALEAVFADPYEFEVEFVERREKTEADLFFTRDGSKVDPMTEGGGGAVDIGAFSLRCAVRQLRPKFTRNFLALDEPFRFLSQNLQPCAAEMLKEMRDRLGLQFLIVTHNDTLAECADKVFFVSKRRGKSFVKERDSM